MAAGDGSPCPAKAAIAKQDSLMGGIRPAIRKLLSKSRLDKNTWYSTNMVSAHSRIVSCEAYDSSIPANKGIQKDCNPKDHSCSTM